MAAAMLEKTMNDDTLQPCPRGLLIVMTGASGVGKGTLRELWLQDQNVFFSVSKTTRQARPGERPGLDYHFVTEEEFVAELAQNGFLEHAEFAGNRYGTPKGPIEAALASGQDVILEIEVLGAMQVRQQSSEAVLIFIMPPSLSELRRRLEGRATENQAQIERRLTRAREEILEAHNFDYVVMNDDLERAVLDMHAIQRAERSRSSRISRESLKQIVES
ncbi:guanylate kinase [Deinococcus sp. KNUC1210]|uniref:guanylate kinase n=1 Tax=Deinococcus sp. KNUC1210 TaxID=2917691 RepID=UPI001EF010F5|nr:guanylate kinase [Deinococcus sp. KNUC1210]ULH14803.1 guanylate kinase [Deinococcus sp. KNUC1210]